MPLQGASFSAKHLPIIDEMAIKPLKIAPIPVSVRLRTLALCA
jgi:hypothetical protein